MLTTPHRHLALTTLLIILLISGCASLANHLPFPRNKTKTLTLECDSGWKPTTNLAAIATGDHCTDQFVRILFSNATFADGRVQILPQDRPAGIHVDQSEKAALQAAIALISWKPPKRTATETRRILSQFGVDRYEYRTRSTVVYSMEECRAVLGRFNGQAAAALPPNLEQHLLEKPTLSP